MTFLRAFWLAFLALAYFVAYGARRVGLFLTPAATRPTRKGRLDHLRGRLLASFARRAGATFIKVAQVASARPDLLPPGVVDELRTLQDRVPPFSFRRVRRILAAELGADALTRLGTFEPTPVAAASVAQVHRATLPTGEVVAVKILRPGVEAAIRRDATILRLFARLVALSPRARVMQPVEHVGEFVAAVLAQTDLRRELANNRRFAENFRDVAGVRFPRVLPELSSQRVLTMEFVSGRKLDTLGDPPPGLGDRFVRSYLKMVFTDRFVHADLHPGNCVLDDAGLLAIYDLGLAYDIGPDIGVALVEFAAAFGSGSVDAIVAHVNQRYEHRMTPADEPEFRAAAKVIIDRYAFGASHEIEFGKWVSEIFALIRRYGIKPKPEFTLIIVGVVTMEGLSKRLDPKLQPFQMMVEYVAGAAMNVSPSARTTTA